MGGKPPEYLCGMSTPLQLSVWQNYLVYHPDQQFAQFILRGIQHGFRIGFNGEAVIPKPCMSNMLSANEHPQVVASYLEEVQKYHRIIPVGDMARAAELGIHCSAFGVIPKKHKPNKWRLIVDLSAPEGHSINDGISKELASLSYVSVDDVVACALKEGKGALLAKMDVKQAYRNIPVHPSDRACLGMSWEGMVYVDTVLPFGLRSAPLIFSAVADALQWIMMRKGVRLLFHYIDDFITIGAPDSEECAHNVATMNAVCNETGIPIEQEKNEGPATHITFLGIEIDTVALEIRLPHDKLSVLKSSLQSWRGRKACRKRELLSLCPMPAKQSEQAEHSCGDS